MAKGLSSEVKHVFSDIQGALPALLVNIGRGSVSVEVLQAL